MGDDGGLGLMNLVWGLERPLLFVGLALVFIGAWRFFPLGRNVAFAIEANPGLGLLRAAIVFSGLWFWFILATAADSNIFGFYTGLYTFLAFACLLWGGLWRPILGVWLHPDLVERGNLAAALVLVGFLLGTAFAFGGALTGEDTSCQGDNADRPICQEIRSFSPGETWGTGGWHVVMAFFALAYIELRASVGMVDRIGGGLSRQARVERDWSAGLLLGAVAVACGLISGRAAAGDFDGWGPAFADYGRRIWPILVVPFAGCLVGFLTTDHPRRHLWRGVASAILVAGAAAVYAFT